MTMMMMTMTMGGWWGVRPCAAKMSVSSCSEHHHHHVVPIIVVIFYIVISPSSYPPPHRIAIIVIPYQRPIPAPPDRTKLTASRGVRTTRRGCPPLCAPPPLCPSLCALPFVPFPLCPSICAPFFVLFHHARRPVIIIIPPKASFPLRLGLGPGSVRVRLRPRLPCHIPPRASHILTVPLWRHPLHTVPSI